MMDAHEYNLEILRNGKLSIPNKKEADKMWNNLIPCEWQHREGLMRQWRGVTLPSSGASGSSGICGAIASMKAMGYMVEEAEELLGPGFEALKEENWEELDVITSEIFHCLYYAQQNPNHRYMKFRQFTTWEEYCACIEEWPRYAQVSPEDYAKKTRAGWYGQMIAGTAGSQLEGYYYEVIAGNIQEFKDYQVFPCTYNDDITYEIAFLEAYKRKGRAITSLDIAREWLRLIPLAMSAEGIAMRNLRQGIYPPESGRMGNYYREWIGAQMRGAICGMLAPGEPYEAARLAWLDGQISHANNGIIGEVFSALLVSLAYVERDIREILKKTLAMLPDSSEYYSVIRCVMDICEECVTWRDAWKKCLKQFAEYSWVHAYPNAAAEVVAAWFGGNDFDKVLEIMCLEGHDADSTAGQLLTAVAIITGVEGIDARWINPISDGLNTYLRGMEKIKIEDLIQTTIEVYTSLCA